MVYGTLILSAKVDFGESDNYPDSPLRFNEKGFWRASSQFVIDYTPIT